MGRSLPESGRPLVDRRNGRETEKRTPMRLSKNTRRQSCRSRSKNQSSYAQERRVRTRFAIIALIRPREPLSRRSCSHTRNTRNPSRRNCHDTNFARLRFVLNFRSQYGRFETGASRPHFGQPCQKQPSTKIAMRSASKTKSGEPRWVRECIRQPVTPLATSAALRRHSVERLPFDRTKLIRWLRSFLLSVST